MASKHARKRTKISGPRVKTSVNGSKFIPIDPLGSPGYYVKANGCGDGIWHRCKVAGVWTYIWCQEYLGRGYRRARFVWRGKLNTFSVHMGIGAAFCGLPPKGFFFCHEKKNKLNCTRENLRLKSSRVHNTLDHNKPAQMAAGKGPWKPRFRDSKTGRFTGGEIPPEVRP